MHFRAMHVQLGFGVELLTTLVTLVLVTSWKVDILHMFKCLRLIVAELATQIALKFPHICSFRQSAGVSVQVLFNSSLIFPTALQFTILSLQCSQVLDELSVFVSKGRQFGLSFDFHLRYSIRYIG